MANKVWSLHLIWHPEHYQLCSLSPKSGVNQKHSRSWFKNKTKQITNCSYDNSNLDEDRAGIKEENIYHINNYSFEQKLYNVSMRLYPPKLFPFLILLKRLKRQTPLISLHHLISHRLNPPNISEPFKPITHASLLFTLRSLNISSKCIILHFEISSIIQDIYIIGRVWKHNKNWLQHRLRGVGEWFQE